MTNSTKTIKILVATHKQYDMPQNAPYLPIQVGAFAKPNLGYLRDDGGDNISAKNFCFCELTALYYGWKNLQTDVLGLVHYRRYFAGKLPFWCNGKKFKILDDNAALKYLQKADIILPKKRRYVIETLYSHYKHTMYEEPLVVTGQIIKETYPNYYAEFQRLKTRRNAHMFNMLVAKQQVLDGYCKWLFDVLQQLETRVEVLKYDDFHRRFCGRISELLLDVYVNVNKLKFVEVKVVNTEKQRLGKRIRRFLRAKFKGEKYDASF